MPTGLLVQPTAQLAVGSQCVGLSTTAVQRRDALGVELLPQRMVRNQAFDLRKGGLVPAQSQLSHDPQPLRYQP